MRKTCDPSLSIFFSYARIILGGTSRLVEDIYRNIAKKKENPVGPECRSRCQLVRSKSLNVPNERRLPTSSFINVEAESDAGQKKSSNPDSSLIVSETLTTLERHVALVVAPRVSQRTCRSRHLDRLWIE